jgi:hypothetical protein
LDPPCVRHDESGELFCEVADHVVPLGLPVHEYIEPDFLLDGHHVVYFGAQYGVVAGIVEVSRTPGRP